jgi:LEA14-like dessication related protein
MNRPDLRRTTISVLIFVISALILTGCAGLQKTYEPPRVTLAGMTIKEARAFETVFLIELRIFNTNDVPMEIKGVDCALEINGKPFAGGISGVDKTIPAYGTDLVSVVVYASVLDTVNRVFGMIRDVQASQKMQNLKYTLKGKLRLAGAIPTSVSFDSEGELNLGELTNLPPPG